MKSRATSNIPQPLLGIFWIYRRRVLPFTVPISSVSMVGGTKDADYAHADSWAVIVKKHRELTDKEYWAIPRGRVIFRVTDGIFVIVASTSIVTDAQLVGKVVRRFHVPSSGQVRAITDRHYDPPDDDLFEE